LTPKLIQQGFNRMDRLEEARANGSLKSDVMKKGGKGNPSFLQRAGVELFLIGEWARLDFSAALSEARSREGPLERLKLLVGIIQRLVNWPTRM
ncbi:MAG: hypothetical protein V3T83_11610, partial [Acidobacteriota bacterium]